MKDKLPKPPSGLSRESRELWVALVADYELGVSDLRTLQCALEALDQYRSALAVLKRKGMTYLNRFKEPRPRPEIAIARDARIAYLRATRQLDLEGLPEREARPPALRGLAGGKR